MGKICNDDILVINKWLLVIGIPVQTISEKHKMTNEVLRTEF